MRSSILLCAALVGCGSQLPGPAAPSPRPAATPRSLSIGPLSYFQDRCARCHGAYGSFFPDALKTMSDAALATKIDQMCRGPGAMPLGPEDLSAQVAFHQSLIHATPFIAVTQLKGELRGEATPGARLWLIQPTGSVEIPVEGHEWRCPAPPEGGWKLESRQGDRMTVLDPENSPFASGFAPVMPLRDSPRP